MWYVREVKRGNYKEVSPDFKFEYYNYGPDLPPPGPINWGESTIAGVIPGPGPAGSYVTYPNWFEKLRGITFDDKVIKAINKCQKWCDKQNRKGKEGPYGYNFGLEEEAIRSAQVS